MPSVFTAYKDKMWPHRFAGQLLVGVIAGGTPTDPKVAEGWLKTKLGLEKDDQIRAMVHEVMADRGVDVETATKIVDMNKHLNGFRKDETGLYVEGRQLKAALKEAASCAMAADKLPARGWGKTNKGLLNYMAEHVFVEETKLYLYRDGQVVTQPDDVMQRFVHTFRGSGIQYEEFVEMAEIRFTAISDHDFSDEEWAAIWTTGEYQGLGASRSQGFGRYEVTRWDRLH